MIDYSALEKKWQKAWADAKVYEPEPNEKEGFTVTFAFPYVNSPMHAGHTKTYSLTDAYARYLRMKGYNVLFPSGFHFTGVPVLAMAKRLAQGDKDLIKDFKEIYFVPEADIAKMKDPLYLAKYFAEDIEQGFREGGLSIDWRRKFTTIDQNFSKMIEWQFQKLKEKGYLVKGTHPVPWCTNDQNAVGGHDTKGEAQPEIEELILIKFKDSASDIYFPCTTYRPETIYGVTNIFIKQDVVYSIVEIDKTSYYMSKEAVFALSHQFEVTIKGEIKATDLLTKKAINPITKEEVPVLPGFFVKPDVGTGIVMSVPAHAPFDYAALERLKSSGYSMPNIEYKKIIEIKNKNQQEVDPRIPVLAHLELLSANPNSLDDVLEKATKELYREESRYGVMLVGNYAGKPEPVARDGIKGDMIKSNDAMLVYVIANETPVICRCGTRVIVKIVSDQWFINYGDKQWKAQVHEATDRMKILPKKLRQTINGVIDWLDLRATERAHGLGTPFPFNPEHIIESLGDSTIYPAYYTFVQILNANKVSPEQLKPEFFDYVLCATGDLEKVSQQTGIDTSTIKQCKDSFEYWYVNTSNHSGSDLINNHFVMYLFNHAAIFSGKYYPKQIVPNGLLLFEGEKMSKSLGNTVPIRQLYPKYGVDPIRFTSIATANLDSDTNFELGTINSVKQKNEFLMSCIDTLNELKGVELEHIDYWLYSKINTKIEKATEHMDEIELRDACTETYYNSIAELKWYIERGGKNQIVMREMLENVALMISPIMPHFSEELWSMLGNKTLIAQERWPTSDKEMINEKVERIEDIILETAEDINKTMALTSKISANSGKKVKEIKVIVADDWKRTAYNMLLDKKEISKIVNEKEFSGVDKEKVSKFLAQFMSKLATLQKLPEITSDELYSGFLGSKDYTKKKYSTEISVEKENASKSQRAARALPNKPSIDIIWG